MAPSSNASTIINTGSGSGTGERVVQTADGTVWQVVDHLPPRGTGDRQGVIVNGRVKE